MSYALVQADGDLFRKLIAQWEAQVRDYYPSQDGMRSVYLEHADSIASKEAADPTYGIFVMCSGDDFPLFCHMNRARLPGTDGVTLRVVWIRLAPRFDTEEVTERDVGDVYSSLLINVLEHAIDRREVDHVKVLLNSGVDRSFANGFAHALRTRLRHGATETAAAWVGMRGSWLHIDHVRSVVTEADT